MQQEPLSGLESHTPCLVVLDLNYRLISAELKYHRLIQGMDAPPDSLPAALEAAVRDAHGMLPEAPIAAATKMAGDLLVSVMTLSGPAGTCLAVTLEDIGKRDPVLLAMERFGLTAREGEVLRCILEGKDANSIASELNIAKATVHQYFKYLNEKTGSQNRSELIPRIFNWQPPR